MISIGGRRVIGSGNIIVPNGEQATIEYRFDDDKDSISMSFMFVDIKDDKETEPYLEMKGSEEKSFFEFRNFNSATGHTLGSPLGFATSDAGENITLLATVYKYKRSHRIAFQVMVGGSDE